MHVVLNAVLNCHLTFQWLMFDTTPRYVRHGFNKQTTAPAARRNGGSCIIRPAAQSALVEALD